MTTCRDVHDKPSPSPKPPCKGGVGDVPSLHYFFITSNCLTIV